MPNTWSQCTPNSAVANTNPICLLQQARLMHLHSLHCKHLNPRLVLATQVSFSPINGVPSKYARLPPPHSVTGDAQHMHSILSHAFMPAWGSKDSLCSIFPRIIALQIVFHARGQCVTASKTNKFMQRKAAAAAGGARVDIWLLVCLGSDRNISSWT